MLPLSPLPQAGMSAWAAAAAVVPGGVRGWGRRCGEVMWCRGGAAGGGATCAGGGGRSGDAYSA
jgi:hypothetical protein